MTLGSTREDVGKYIGTHLDRPKSHQTCWRCWMLRFYDEYGGVSYKSLAVYLGIFITFICVQVALEQNPLG